MIVLDANLLIYGVNQDAPLHVKAKPWLEEVLAGPESVGFAWITLLAFLRLSTRAAILPRPLSVGMALDLVDDWLRQPSATIVEATPSHPKVMRDLLLHLGTGGNLTSDAHLAAIAIEHGATLCSTDNDFSRMPGLNWKNPLAA